jgi:hypothetical protein
LEQRTVLDAESFEIIGVDAYYDNLAFSQFDGTDYAIAILDTGWLNWPEVFGPDLNDDDVPDRIVAQYDFYNNFPTGDGNANEEDESGPASHGHGSVVASVIAEMAPEANLIVVKTHHANSATRGLGASITAALEWVYQNRNTYNIVAVNMSFGNLPLNGLYEVPQTATSYTETDPDTITYIQNIHAKVAQLDSARIVCVAAAGNGFGYFASAPGVVYPAASPHVIAVGATWDDDVGTPTPTSDYLEDSTGPDRVMAMGNRGEDILEMFAPGGFITAPSPYEPFTAEYGGTSFATPHVAAAALLAQQLNDEFGFQAQRFNVEEIIELMQDTGVQINDGDDEDMFDTLTPTGKYYKRLDFEAMAYKLFKPATAPDLVAGSDWGFSNTDNKTGDTTPTFIGTAPPNSHVWLYFGSTEVANGAADSNGDYTLTPSAQSLTGSWSVTVKVAANSNVIEANRSQASPALVVTHSESKNLGAESFSAKLHDSLTVLGANTGSSTLEIVWAASPERTIIKTGTGTVTIGGGGSGDINDRTKTVTYNNQNGTTNFNTDTGVAATQVGHTRVANWSVSATLGTGASSSIVEFNTTQNLAAVSAAGTGAVVKIAQNGSRVLVVDSVAVSNGGKLDMYDNDLILKATSATEVALYNALYGLVDSAFGSGNWAGSGVTSTTAAGLPGSYSLGLARNSQFPNAGVSSYTTFSGQLVGTYDILLKFTWRGDADLNGLVNNNDVSILGAFYAPGYTGKHWWQGDNDFDGDVDNNDVTYQNANYNPNGTQL